MNLYSMNHEFILISNSENQIKLLFWFKKSLKELKKKVEKEIQKVEWSDIQNYCETKGRGHKFIGRRKMRVVRR